ncbi:hypothetical protein Cs7R123_56530 [Catellatospora sp. TT07R-123]|uniref:hypothetical protein n=1 Tax=Catellatospora sp. TT07R-123 TaxID=2733863 RepID=UPI001B10E428|nr:hypothetical protein [Catellatospora sp. TT07R-123]GHJ48311.1 hypothetical protein Cs7R123_56530 [Catellatospora sp. TT07R-123]
MEIDGGLFALGGVALAAAFTEIRAWREDRSRRAHDLHVQRREVYAAALREVESVTSELAKLINYGAGDREEQRRAVWSALVRAYEVLNQVRLLAENMNTAGAMSAVLRVYRDALEQGATELPDPRELRRAMVGGFREDLGIDGLRRRWRKTGP